jgi:3-dehydroquinate dehydratase-1
LRADYLTERTPDAIRDLLPRLAEYGIPILFTNRAATEGGAPGGDEATRIATIVAAIESGIPALVDLELATAPALRERVIAAGKGHGIPIMLSSHDFDATPPDEELLTRLAAMAEAGADAAKLALMPREASDAVRLLTLCRATTATPAALPLAAMSMGPLGVITRVIGHRAGSALTFAALTAGSGSAPGQLTLAELRALWTATGEPHVITANARE